MLVRERALVRIHADLDDDDAWAIALARPLLAEPLLASELGALRGRLEGTPAERWAPELVDAAVARAPVEPAQRERFLEWLRAAEARRAEGDAVEVTPDELAEDLGRRLFELNQDLSVAADAWEDLPAAGRRAILEQVRWIAGLLAFMESR
jgi:hypothetical protein